LSLPVGHDVIALPCPASEVTEVLDDIREDAFGIAGKS